MRAPVAHLTESYALSRATTSSFTIFHHGVDDSLHPFAVPVADELDESLRDNLPREAELALFQNRRAIMYCVPLSTWTADNGPQGRVRWQSRARRKRVSRVT